MDALLLKTAEQVPALTVMALIVWFFLRFCTRTSLDRDVLIREMHSEHIRAREESREVLRESAINIRENTKALLSLTLAVERVKTGDR